MIQYILIFSFLFATTFCSFAQQTSSVQPKIDNETILLFDGTITLKFSLTQFEQNPESFKITIEGSNNEDWEIIESQITKEFIGQKQFNYSLKPKKYYKLVKLKIYSTLTNKFIIRIFVL